MANPIYQAAANSVEIDTSGSIVELISGGSTFGTVIQQVVLQATGNVSSGMIRFYIKTDSVNWRLFREVPIPEVIATDQYSAYSSILSFNNLTLPNGIPIGVSTAVSESFVVAVFGLIIDSYS